MHFGMGQAASCQCWACADMYGWQFCSVVLTVQCMSTDWSLPTPHAEMQVHRVLLADSGTLLVCLIDQTGNLNHLRAQLQGAFPGAPTRQTQIMHVSVLRLLTAKQLSPEQRQHLQAVCDKYTAKLKGMQVTATELW